MVVAALSSPVKAQTEEQALVHLYLFYHMPLTLPQVSVYPVSHLLYVLLYLMNW